MKRKKLTLEQFKAIPFGEVFAKGEIPNSPEGIFMNRDGGMLKWVAKKGGIHDWAVYVYWDNVSFTYVRDYGDKVQGKEYITKVVPCTDEVYELYRHQ